jgi:putative transposase
LKHLKKKQRQLSRTQKWSANRNKARLAVARIHEKVSNQRSDFLHKLSTKLIRENQAVCIEDLNVSGMVKNHKLAQAISDCGWRQFRTMLEYKAEWYGRKVYVCGRFEPSSKTCTCWHINNELKLSMREWTCPKCGTRHDRDILAANNIKTFALTKVGMTWCNASGDDTIVSSVKEEAVK